MNVLQRWTPARKLAALGVAQVGVYLAIAWLSPRFVVGQSHGQRPLLEVVGLFVLAFACYLMSLKVLGVIGQSPTPVGRAVLTIVFCMGALFRVILLLSTPIQEIDVYRYLWDGRVLAQGVSPYKYSPEEVDLARKANTARGELQRLVGVLESSPSMRTIFGNIHYRQVPTVYPPASQAVFAVAALLTPIDAPVRTHLIVMKGVLLSFDVGTAVVLLGLLSHLGFPRSWVAVYFWCPLVMKEIANSGHLDSIAVFFLTLTVLLVVKAGSNSLAGNVAGGVCWSLSILAKCFPVVLAPLFLTWWWRRLRGRAFFPLVAAAATLIAGYVLTSDRTSSASKRDRPEVAANHDSLEGLRTFLSFWEMNDLLFNVVVSNIQPPRKVEGPDGPVETVEAWYVVVPRVWRIRANAGLSGWLAARGVDAASLDLPFLVAQAVMGTVLVAVVLALTRSLGDTDLSLVQRVFWCLAWMWYLVPTQNPWYWTWALPFLPFVRGPWLMTSGLALLYYLRFWFLYHFPDRLIWPTPYVGPQFFDFVLVWLEHLPVLAALAWLNVRR